MHPLTSLYLVHPLAQAAGVHYLAGNPLGRNYSSSSSGVNFWHVPVPCENLTSSLLKTQHRMLAASLLFFSLLCDLCPVLFSIVQRCAGEDKQTSCLSRPSWNFFCQRTHTLTHRHLANGRVNLTPPQILGFDTLTL